MESLVRLVIPLEVSGRLHESVEGESLLSEPADAIPEMIAIALLSALLCILQFVAGRRIGARYGDRISAAQGLGQKNTVLAIWLTLTYLNPIASIGPAAYVLWQNSINSAQLYYKMKKTTQAR